jgi:hypothetical protein
MLPGGDIVCGRILLFFLLSSAKLYLCCSCRFGFLYVCSSCLGSMLAFMFVFWFCCFGFVGFVVWIFLDRQVVALLLLLWFHFWFILFLFHLLFLSSYSCFLSFTSWGGLCCYFLTWLLCCTLFLFRGKVLHLIWFLKDLECCHNWLICLVERICISFCHREVVDHALGSWLTATSHFLKQ